MGPFSERKQFARAEAIAKLLRDPDLSPWAREYWSRVIKNLARNETEYNFRVKNIYQHHKQWRNPFDD